MRSVFILFLSIVVGWTGLQGQTTDSRPRSVEAKLTAKILLAKDGVLPGTECAGVLIVSIDEGWHINSFAPDVEGFVATTVEMERTEGVELVDISYPPAFEQSLDFSEIPLEVYEGTIRIMLAFRISLDASPGTYDIPLELRYQACSNEVCLAPAAVQVDIPLRVVENIEDVLLINRTYFEEKER